jgi:hypothetical protein
LIVVSAIERNLCALVRDGFSHKRNKSNSEGVQELLFDSFLQAEITELLKYGTFAGEVRLYTMHAIKPA